MSIFKKSVSLIVFLVVIGFSGCATVDPPETVSHVDLKRYVGTWHEVARYPNWFQRDCAGEVTATYAANPDGSISVVNKCRKKDGSEAVARGTAKVVPKSGNARLKVSFFGPFTGDYWVLGLDPDYQWALVGAPSRKYLWILSREAKVSDERYKKIVQIAVEKGFVADRLVRAH